MISIFSFPKFPSSSEANLVLIQAQSVLGLIRDGLVSPTVDVLVLATTDLVAEGLAGGLFGVGTRAAVWLLGTVCLKEGAVFA